MKYLFVIGLILMLLACEQNNNEGVGWVEMTIFKYAFSWSCEGSQTEMGISESEAKRQCDCMLQTIEDELTSAEWEELFEQSNNSEEGMPVLDRLEPQFQACASKPVRQDSSSESGAS